MTTPSQEARPTTERTDMTDLIKLAERVEALDGPDREVDIAIAEAVGIRLWYAQGDPEFHYTASIDAAVSLAGDSVRHIEWCDGFVEAAVLTDSITASARAATPALALTAAMLYAQGERSKT